MRRDGNHKLVGKANQAKKKNIYIYIYINKRQPQLFIRNVVVVEATVNCSLQIDLPFSTTFTSAVGACN